MHFQNETNTLKLWWLRCQKRYRKWHISINNTWTNIDISKGTRTKKQPIDQHRWTGLHENILVTKCELKNCPFFSDICHKKGDINEKPKNMYVCADELWGVIVCNIWPNFDELCSIAVFDFNNKCNKHAYTSIWSIKTCLWAGIMVIWVRFSWQMPKHFMKHSLLVKFCSCCSYTPLPRHIMLWIRGILSLQEIEVLRSVMGMQNKKIQ